MALRPMARGLIHLLVLASYFPPTGVKYVISKIKECRVIHLPTFRMPLRATPSRVTISAAIMPSRRFF